MMRLPGFRLFAVILLFIVFVPVQSPAQLRLKIGGVTAVEKDVEGRLGKSTEKLFVGSDLFLNQIVRTGEASRADLRFMDDTTLNLSPRTEITLDRFVYQPGRKTSAVVIQMPRGLARVITGSLEPKSYTLRTPIAIIGVRGTTFDVLVRSDRMSALLLNGALQITARSGRIFFLDRPNTAITIYRDGRVIGPRNWSGAITDFASLRPPPPLQRTLEGTAPGPSQTQQAGSRSGGARTTLDRFDLGPSSGGPASSSGSRPSGRGTASPGAQQPQWKTWAPSGAKQ